MSSADGFRAAVQPFAALVFEHWKSATETSNWDELQHSLQTKLGYQAAVSELARAIYASDTGGLVTFDCYDPTKWLSAGAWSFGAPDLWPGGGHWPKSMPAQGLASGAMLPLGVPHQNPAIAENFASLRLLAWAVRGLTGLAGVPSALDDFETVSEGKVIFFPSIGETGDTVVVLAKVTRDMFEAAESGSEIIDAKTVSKLGTTVFVAAAVGLVVVVAAVGFGVWFWQKKSKRRAPITVRGVETGTELQEPLFLTEQVTEA